MSTTNRTNNNNNNVPPQPAPNAGNRRFREIPQAPKLEFLRDKILTDYVAAREKAQKAKDQDIVAFIGMSGKGKSTCVNSVMGCPLGMNSKGSVEVLGRQIGPIIGKVRNSESSYAETFDVDGEQFKATDTGGFCDTFGTLKDYTNAVSMFLTLQAARSVKFVMCCTVADLNDKRSKDLRKAAQIIHENILHGALELRDSIILLATQSEDYKPERLQTIIADGVEETCQVCPDLKPLFDRMTREKGKFVQIYEPCNLAHRASLLSLIRELPAITEKRAICVGYPDAGLILDDFLRIARYERDLIDEYFNNRSEVDRVQQRITELDNRITQLEQSQNNIKLPQTNTKESQEDLNRRHEARLIEVSNEITNLTQTLQTTESANVSCFRLLKELESIDNDEKKLEALTFDFSRVTTAKQMSDRDRIQKCSCDEEIGRIEKSVDGNYWRVIQGGIGTKVYEVLFRSVKKIKRERPGITCATITLYSKRNYEKGDHRQAKSKCVNDMETNQGKIVELKEKIKEKESDKKTIGLYIEGGKKNILDRDQNQAVLNHLQTEIEASKQLKLDKEAKLGSIKTRNQELKRAIESNSPISALIFEHLKVCSDLVSEDPEIIKFKGLKEKFNQNN